MKFLRGIRIIGAMLMGIIIDSPTRLVAQLPEDFTLDLISKNWFSVTGITFDEQGRLFGWSKFGHVYVAAQDYTDPQLLLDISEEVATFGDLGLIGFALHPNFTENGYIYLLYVVDPHYLYTFGTAAYDPGHSETHQATIGRITRYTVKFSAEALSVDPLSRKILMGAQDAAPGSAFAMLFDSHGVGSLAFGADGSLLASCGDGASYKGIDAGAFGENTGSYTDQALEEGIIRPDQDIGTFRSQYLHSPNGKILRLDPETGAGMPGNPFFEPENPFSTASRVWALGFRQPFRFTHRPGTGDHDPMKGDPGTFILGEVGWAYWEELNVMDKGGKNYGWPIYGGMVGRWQFNRWASPVPFPLADNPAGDCQGGKLLFQDLLVEAEKNTPPIFPNPCNPALFIPPDIPQFVHQRPVISWSNQEWNNEEQGTHIPGFDSLGKARIIRFEEPENPVKGEPFTGTCSVGGAFYYGDNFPAEYQGVYFHGDYSGWIRQFVFGPNNELLAVKPFADTTQNIVSLAVNPKDGALYYIRYGFWSTLYKISYGGNALPRAKILLDTAYGASPLTVNFDASQSFDPDGDSLQFLWKMGDLSITGPAHTQRTFTEPSGSPRSFPITLTVIDGRGGKTQQMTFVSVNNTPPKVEITGIPDSAYYSISEASSYLLGANVVDQEHPNEVLRYEWQSFLHHNTHNHPEPIVESLEHKLALLPLGCEDETYYYRVRLTVTDPEGLQGVAEAHIYPDCGPPPAEFGETSFVSGETDLYIQWKTHWENKCDSFEIAVSTGEGDYQVLGMIPGRGTQPGIHEYQFRHVNPAIAHHAYRIRAINRFGSYVESEASTFFTPLHSAFRLFPNPGSARLHLQVWDYKGPVKFSLSDLSGKIVWEHCYQPLNFEPITFSLGHLANGLYFYQLATGKEKFEGKWQKQTGK